MPLAPLYDPEGHRWVSPGEWDCPHCRCCTQRLCTTAREQSTTCDWLNDAYGPDVHDVSKCPCCDPKTLWAVHYQGPDTIRAAVDYADAVKAVGQADDLDIALAADSDWNPSLSAVVILWQLSADQHAADLAKEPGV